MDVLAAVLESVQPSTWVNKSVDHYTNSYLLFDVDEYSPEWIRLWLEFDGNKRSLIHSIQRVQNPFQLGLFRVQEEKRRKESVSANVNFGYHVIHPEDLNTAMKYPLDYRRYSHRNSAVQSEGKHPRFFSSANSAYDHGCSLCNDKIMIIKSEHFSPVKNQGDYYPCYIITLFS